MNTLGSLYLGSEPSQVQIADDHLVVLLADGHSIAIPLQMIGQLGSHEPLPADSTVLILSHPPQIDHVHVTDRMLTVYLRDGRSLSCPLAWFPRLLHGTPAERNDYLLSGEDAVIHWPQLDEDIELTRLFQGGQSTESEHSIQKWLRSRLPVGTPSM